MRLLKTQSFLIRVPAIDYVISLDYLTQPDYGAATPKFPSLPLPVVDSINLPAQQASTLAHTAISSLDHLRASIRAVFDGGDPVIIQRVQPARAAKAPPPRIMFL
ncbi:hypothetical protein PG994_014147 [Apiospora phragmitis]|uniref:Uncharacterized protein n=1 Tax=Apiospora phragmitis TaxID=2905665 RepID=A0ABR1T3G2_9PEZI